MSRLKARTNTRGLPPSLPPPYIRKMFDRADITYGNSFYQAKASIDLNLDMVLELKGQLYTLLSCICEGGDQFIVNYKELLSPDEIVGFSANIKAVADDIGGVINDLNKISADLPSDINSPKSEKEDLFGLLLFERTLVVSGHIHDAIRPGVVNIQRAILPKLKEYQTKIELQDQQPT